MKTNQFKTLLLFLLAAIHGISANGQAPSWAWAVDTDGPGVEMMHAVAAAPDGVIYVLGDFKDSFTFGPEVIAHPGVMNPNVGLPVLSKMTGAGEVEWALPLFDPNLQYYYLGVFGMDTDSEGNVYIAGMVFRGPIVGAYTVNLAGVEFTVPASTFGDSFIVKIDPEGNAQWVRHTATEEHPGWGAGHMIVVDENDLVYWSARFQMATIEIDGVVYTKMGVPGNTHTDIFLGCLDTDGEFVWFQTMGSEGGEGFNNIAPAVGGGVLMSSAWTGAMVHVGGLTAINPEPLFGDNWDRWIAKINATGEADWLVREGGVGNENAGFVAPTAMGGAMVSSALVNPISLNDVEYEELGHLLTKYSSTGILEEVYFYPANNVGGSPILFDGDDTYYLQFNYYSPTFFFGDLTATNNGGLNGTADFVVLAVDGSGNTLWAISNGGQENDLSRDAAFSPTQGLIIGGIFDSSPVDLGTTTLQNNGFFTYDFFVGALDFTSGIAEAPGVLSLGIFPNPTAQHLHIDLTHLPAEQHALRIFDTRGSLVLSQAVSGGAVQRTEVARLPAGNYIMLIQSDGAVYAAKFVKT